MRTLPFPIKVFLWFCLSISSAITIACLSIYLYLVPSLPDTNELKNVELQTPLRIYSQDGRLIGEFGEKKRNPLKYEEVPARFIQALLASEDDGFFQHGGIDIKGLLRASGQLVVSGRIRSGGSTITMQVAKNYFLSSEKSFSRKFTEILLALKIEQNLTKEEILELYVNKIFLGKSAYGIQAAAQVYYGKPINELTLSETAMIAGLPQAPSAANPLNNPKRAIDRRNYVLSRMKVLGMIDQSTYDEAIKQPVTASNHGSAVEHPAPYIAEMVRQKLEETYGHRIYTEGFIVSTTIDSRAQLAASEALQHGLLAYDRAHGWREKPAMARMETVQKNGSPVEFSQFVEVEPLANGLYIDWVATLENWRSDLFPQDSRSLVFKAHVSK
ncbi:MAG: transglycosylase domain-containing protein, partial [Oceanobacter sp.]